MKIEIEKWRQICTRIFTTIGIEEHTASIIVDAAITADMRGVASHGTVRLSTYRKRLECGVMNSNPKIRIENENPTFLYVDGDNGPGQVVAYKALEMAIERAKTYGCCAISIHNTNHMGMLSYYALKAAEKNCISNIMCNTPPFVAAVGGAEPILGTNPICWGIPAYGFPIIMDMAISPARGKIKNALDKDDLIPEGWALDKEGNPTTDPAKAMEGVLLPSGGIKGYGIGIIVELMTGILSNSSFGKHMPHPLDDFENKPDVGDFLLVLDVEKIIPIEQFKARIQEYVEMVKNSKKSVGSSGIFFPGELENIKENKVKVDGLEIGDALFKNYIKLAGE